MSTPEKKPFPKDPGLFANDDRISYSHKAETFVLEEPTTGEEYEWRSKHSQWVAVIDEALLAQQDSIFAVAGVDESEPAMVPRKRKADDEARARAAAASKKAKRDPRPTAIYVTGIPLDASQDEIISVFDRFGVITESLDTDEKRVYMYSDTEGKFKGDALIIYFKPESVDLAIMLLDESDFRPGKPNANGPLRVQVADRTRKVHQDKPWADAKAARKGTDAFRDRKKAIRKNEELNARLANWDEDSDEERRQKQRKISSRSNKTVVIKRMFTAEDATDPEEMFEIEKDLRVEAEKHGPVTYVSLYDLEEEGVATVRFVDEKAARACAAKFSRRKYDGKPVEAYIATGSERFKKNARNADDEEARLEAAVRATEDQDD